jgi:outer membrane protein assembly factor BamA
LAVACCVVSGCASIPKHDAGVSKLDVTGMHQLDEAALKVCLATQARERAGLTLGVAGDAECGVPPFDATRVPVNLWTWPWTEWPLYDETVWNRDIARVARWYRARGYYDARVTAVSQTPHPDKRTIDLALTVEEKQPVRIALIDLVGTDATDRGTRAALQAALLLHVGDRFDEALHDDTKRALVDALRERAYALGAVEGAVSVDAAKHSATIQYHIVAGRRFRFGEVTVEGQEELPVRPMLAAAKIEEGAPFSVSVLEDAKRAIYELGPFASVEFNEHPRSDQARVDIQIKVVPGRQFRTAVGAGMQVGTDPTLTPTDAPSDSLNLWDLHLLGRIEHRNFLGGMRRITIEDRPRVLFSSAFPRADTPHVGNLLILDFRQPSFFEARTSFTATVRWDRGPDPYTYVLRDDFLAGMGPERTFFGGKLRASATVNVNLFVPQSKDQITTARVNYPQYHATYMQYAVALDLRDQPREPRSGTYFSLAVQHAGYLPIFPSEWDYVRITPDVRGYVPLPFGMVLAGRVRIGIMEITNSSIKVSADDTFGIQQRLRDLGPLRQRLRGGGNNSVRGYRPNTLGDITEIGEVVDSGGLRQWEASVELRTPITASFGTVLFIDLGDVTRQKVFRLYAPQTSFGFGLRYRTIIGPVRLDLGFAPDALQVFGSKPRDRQAYDALNALEPYPESHLPLTSLRGAVHFTIGEAY